MAVGPCAACTSAAGSYCPPGGTNATGKLCAPGRYSTAANAKACTVCPAGKYGSTSGLKVSTCSGACVASVSRYCAAGATTSNGIACPASYPGAATGLTNVYAACNGTCAAGYACPGGVGQVKCAAGRYFDGFSFDEFYDWTCYPCPFGTYALTNVTGLNTSACSGSCTAGMGWHCPVGTSSPVGVPCPAGRWSDEAYYYTDYYSLRDCEMCPPGLYGTVVNATSQDVACTGVCSSVPGAYCGLGMSARNGSWCPAGQFSSRYNATVCQPCPNGTYGATSGLASPTCSGNCSSGYTCPQGSNTATSGLACLPGQYSPPGSGTGACQDCLGGYACPLKGLGPLLCYPGSYAPPGVGACASCPAGVFGNASGLNSSSCSGPCRPGFACASGSVLGVACALGRYSLAGAVSCTACLIGTFGNTTGLTTAACSGVCPAGVYGNATALTSPACRGPCSPGYACPANSTNATVSICTPGKYSSGGLGVCSPCPVGVYGSASGLTSPACSGPCTAGYACPAGSTSSLASICSPGLYSTSGLGVCSPCPLGVYGSTSGVTSPACSGSCSAGCVPPTPTVHLTTTEVE
jgi:hypothetical protein